MALISIVTIVRNDSPGLLRTRASITCQEWRDFEWLVVDGASTDGTAQLALGIDDAFVRAYSEPDEGIYDAMNKGLTLATGQFVVFLNAGDALADSGLLKRVAARLTETDADFLYGDSLEAFSSVQPICKLARGHQHVRYGMFACHGAMYYRRALIGEARYDTTYRISGDYCFTAEFLKKLPRIAQVDEPLCIFDLSGVSSMNRRRGRAENWRVQREVLSLSLMHRCAIRAVYLGTALLATYFPGVYKVLRFRRRNEY